MLTRKNPREPNNTFSSLSIENAAAKGFVLALYCTADEFRKFIGPSAVCLSLRSIVFVNVIVSGSDLSARSSKGWNGALS